MGHPDFRVDNRIFATLHADNKFGMVALTPEQQQGFIAEHPDAFTPESGAWGRAGCTRVHLAWKEHCAVLNGILRILRTGAPWADLPTRYFREIEENEIFWPTI